MLESLWASIDELVKRKEIVTCGQIAREIIGDNLAARWVSESGTGIITEDELVKEKDGNSRPATSTQDSLRRELCVFAVFHASWCTALSPII